MAEQDKTTRTEEGEKALLDSQQTNKVVRDPAGVDGRPSLVVLHGANMGTRHSLNSPITVLGRSSGVDIQLVDDSVSRQHAQIEHESEGFRVRDLESTNGTFVNDQRVDDQLLCDGDIIQVGESALKFLSGETIESQYHDDVYRLSTYDSLTQAYNKRYLIDALGHELNRSNRHGNLLSLIMLDIDGFKQINDKHGHLAGDYILMELALLVMRNIRKEDIFARYGGEEFALVLPETAEAGAQRVCEKLRALVEEHAFEYGNVKIPVTISLGACALKEVRRDLDIEAIIAQADGKLYEAKQDGRNCFRF